MVSLFDHCLGALLEIPSAIVPLSIFNDADSTDKLAGNIELLDLLKKLVAQSDLLQVKWF